jgi:energy-coupling factor transporter transmembrane protein EcfT
LDEMNLIDRVRKGLVPIVIPLFLSLLRKAQDMDVAIESRAFGAPVERTYMESIDLGFADGIFILLTIVFCVGLIAGSEYLGLEAGLAGIQELVK